MRIVLELVAILALAAVSGTVYTLMCSTDTEKHLPWVSKVYEGSDFLTTPSAKGAPAPPKATPTETPAPPAGDASDGKGANSSPAPGDPGASSAPVEPPPGVTVKDGARAADGEFAMIELSAVIQELDAGSVFIDARRTRDYDAGHIPGAISMSPWEADLTEKISKLRGEAVLEAPAVVYCSNSKECEDSKLVARQLRGAGFLDIRIFTGGFPEWEKEKPGSIAKGKEPGSWKP